MSRGSSPAPGFVSANRTPRLGRHYCKPLFLGVLAWFLLGLGASAVKGQSYLESIGVPPFTSALPVENGFINAANGNLHLEIPLASYPQRGGREFKVSLMYDSAIWRKVYSSWQPANPTFIGGWRLVTSGDQGSVDFDEYEETWCEALSSYRWINSEPFYWTASDGTMRVFPIHTRYNSWPGECGGLGGGPAIDDDSAYATDGSGYRMDVTNYVDATVYAPDGMVVYSSSTQKHKDANGNYYLNTYTDTAGRTTVTTTLNCNSDSNKICYDVLNSQGTASRYTVTKQTINVYTNFERPYAALLNDGVKFYAVLGNHDELLQRYYPLFNLRGRRYYSFAPRSSVRMIGLDSTRMDEEQLRWLDQELTGPAPQWTIVFMHHPLYSSGERHGPSLRLRGLLESRFNRGAVDVVFGGHEHFYERHKGQGGIQYFISGAAGQLRKGNIRATDQTACGFDQDNSFMLVELTQDALRFEAIARDGSVVDRGVISRDSQEGDISAECLANR